MVNKGGDYRGEGGGRKRQGGKKTSKKNSLRTGGTLLGGDVVKKH